MLRSLALLVLCAAPAAAQLDPLFAPRELERQAGDGLPFGGGGEQDGAVEDGAVLVKRLKRIALSDESGAPLADQEALQQALRPFLGRPLTEGGLDRLTDMIVDHYDRTDRPVVEVFVPDQDLAGGVLRVEVTLGRIGATAIGKTRHFNDGLLAGALRLPRGAVLRSSRLEAQQDWFNRNPFRSAQLYAAPGEGFAEADLLFSFEERYPLRAYLGYENTGTPAVGRNRWLAGVNWGNGFGQDHLLSYQFTMGDSLSDFQAHAALWEIPFHRCHQFLRFSAAWAEVSSASSADGFLVEADGTTWQVSAGYGFQLPRWKGFSQELVVGAEFKTTDNFLVFGGVTPGGAVVDVVQARVDYTASRRTERDALQFTASLVASPGGMSSNNEDANFAAFREGAEAGYVFGRVDASWLRRLPDDWTLRLAGRAQWAGGALLPIEQLAFGGRDSIRGYDERIALSDSGYHLTTEIRTPGISLPGEALGGTTLQFLGFVDQGTGWNEGGGSESFLGVGGGVRLQSTVLGDLRADVAWPLDGGDGPQLHLGLVRSF